MVKEIHACSLVNPENSYDPMEWCLDSGCTRHMAADRSLFHDYHKSTGYVRVANNAVIKIVGTGNVIINTVVDGKSTKTTLEGVLHVPDLAANLLSEDQLVYESKLSIQHDSENGLRISNRDGVIVGATSRINRQQILNTIFNTAYSATQNRSQKRSQSHSQKRQRTDNTEDLQTWHKRLGHLHFDAVKKLASG